MPRVCHVTSVHPVFDVRVFRKECVSLARAGYEVTLVAQGTREETVQGVRIVPLRPPRSRVARLVGTALEAWRRAWRVDADLYHFHDPELVPGGLWLRGRGRRVVYDAHEDAPRDIATRDYLPGATGRLMAGVFERVEDHAAARFSALVAATPAIGERFERLNPRTVVVNNYPITDELSVMGRGPWSARPNRIAYVGGIAAERGLCEMVEAMPRVSPSLGARLELVGTFSSPEDRLRASRLEGWGQVEERGELTRGEVAEVLGRVRAGLVLFHPLPNNLRAQPNKLFEYMSAGLPVIASDFPLWRELVLGSGCGLVVDPLDPRAIAGAIECVLTRPAEAEAMGRRGREAVETRYNWALEERKLLALYEDLLSVDAGAAPLRPNEGDER
jgi:glycosyltransferase involved in cell wall biosynthesis